METSSGTELHQDSIEDSSVQQPNPAYRDAYNRYRTASRSEIVAAFANAKSDDVRQACADILQELDERRTVFGGV